MDGVSRITSRTFLFGLAATGMMLAWSLLWARERPDRLIGLLLGGAAGAVRTYLSGRLVRRLSTVGPRGYAVRRVLLLLPLAAALAAGGLLGAVDLFFVVVSIFLWQAAAIAGAVSVAARARRR